MFKRFILCLSLIAVVSCFFTPQTANAQSIVVDVQKIWDIFEGSTERDYSNEIETFLFDSQTKLEKEIVEILVKDRLVLLDETGRAGSIDVVARFSDGTYENIARYATWTSSNEDVVTVERGRLTAGEKGISIVSVSCQGFEKQVCVIVKKTIDVAEKVAALKAANNKASLTVSRSFSQREQTFETAYNMVHFYWTPKEPLTKWSKINNEKSFPAGSPQQGMPYSQTPKQCLNYEAFIDKLESDVSDFYVEYESGEYVMPMYGNDCSGFVSGAWEIERTDTQTFLKRIRNNQYKALSGGYIINYDPSKPYKERYTIESYNAETVRASFDNLQTGDALIRLGHIILVDYVDISSKVVYVFEQTGSQAIYKSYTYNSLTNQKFIPFTIFED